MFPKILNVFPKKMHSLHRCIAARGDDDTHLGQKCNGREIQLFGMETYISRRSEHRRQHREAQHGIHLPSSQRGLFSFIFGERLEIDSVPLDTWRSAKRTFSRPFLETKKKKYSMTFSTMLFPQLTHWHLCLDISNPCAPVTLNSGTLTGTATFT